jgi:hypothetical protein
MMVVWPKHVVAVTSEEERRNYCVDWPLIAELIYTRNRKHTTITTIRDFHSNHNSWLHIQLRYIVLRCFETQANELIPVFGLDQEVSVKEPRKENLFPNSRKLNSIIGRKLWQL